MTSVRIPEADAPGPARRRPGHGPGPGLADGPAEWPAVRGDLDRGTLSPLGLVRVKSRDPRDLGANHQVLAWGYDLDGTRLTLRLYDPNHPDDDQVTLSLDTARPRRPTPVTSSHGGTVWCLFRTAYHFKDPRPALAALRA